MVMVTTEVTQRNKDAHMLCCCSEPNSSLDLWTLVLLLPVVSGHLLTSLNKAEASFEDLLRKSEIQYCNTEKVG